MGNEVVTTLIIDADTSGAEQYGAAMDKASAYADKFTHANSEFSSSNDRLSLSLAGISVGVVGLIAGVAKGVDYIVGLNKELAALETMAKQTGLSLADFQVLQFGGQVAGLTPDQINAGLEKSAQLLNDAARNSNSLSKELDANGISVKKENGDLISQNQLLGIAADLVSRAKNPGDALAIAQMLGFTKEWVPLLQQGAGAMGELTDQAKAAGAVLDDETVQKATEFDKQWRKSSVEFSSYMKSALLGLLPWFDEIIQKAAEFIKSIDRNKIEEAANAQLNAGAAAVGLPDNGTQASAGLKIDITPDAKKALDDSTSIWQQITATWQAITSGGLTIRVIGPDEAKWTAGVNPVQDTSPQTLREAASVQTLAAAWKDAAKTYLDFEKGVLSGADGISGNFSKVAANANSTKDAFDRAVDAVKKHTDQIAADADAVGLGEGALARYRAEAQLTSAAEAAGIPITDALRQKIKDLAEEAGEVADDRAKVTAQDKADFDLQTAGLSGIELQIAQINFRLHGNYWKDFQNDGLSATERLAANTKQLNDATTQFATSLVDGLIRGGDAMKSLESAAQSLVTTLANQNLKNFLGGGSLFGSQNLNSAQGGLAIGASAVSAYSSGNPLTGALGGALAGAQFGPIGAAIGGLAGAIGGFIGQSSQAEQALKQAQAQWAAMTPQVLAFNEAAKGFKAGPLVNALQKPPIANDNEKKEKPVDRDQHHQAA